MKKLNLLMGIMLVSSIVFSQTVIKNTTDSIVPLPKPVAIEVAKDVIRKDSCEAELIVLNKNYNLSISNNLIKDSIISSKNTQIGLYKEKENNYMTIIDLKDLQKGNLETLNKSLTKELKATKRKLAAKTIVGGIIIGALSYVIIAK